MTSKAIEYKVENIRKYTALTFDESTKGNFENSLNNARKACEAISRAIILKKMTTREGMKVILGEIDVDKRPCKRKSYGFDVPMLNTLLRYLDSKMWVEKSIFYRMQDIRWGGNNASHDYVSINLELSKDDVDLCIEQFKWILKWFYSKILKQPVPTSFGSSLPVSNPIPFTSENLTTWNNFYDNCNLFSNEQRFVLIAPSSFQKLTENELAAFARVKWSLIFDFDPDSKKSGLFKHIHSEFSNFQIRPITIEEKDNKEGIISHSNYALNWFFANGLNELPNTVANTVREWRTTLKYAPFIRKVVRDLLSEKIQNYIFIYLYDDIPHLQTIIPTTDESSTNNKLIKHLIVYQNEELLARLQEEFEQYDAQFYKLPLADIVAGINRSINKEESSSSSKLSLQIPVRTERDDDTFVDISDKYLSYLDRDIEVLHQNISNQKNENLEDNAFYKGNVITWSELSIDLDATRTVIDDLYDYCHKWLDGAKGAYVVDLYHKPGGGGTTLSRRTAYHFHKRYPTILINKFHREKTNHAIFDIAEASKKPILAIIEAFQITQNELNALVRKINEDKKHVVILYVSRSFTKAAKVKDHFKNIYLSDNTIDLNERNRFTAKYLQVAKPEIKASVKSLGEKNPHDCEVIDFVITAYKDDYSAQKVEDYVYHYLDKLAQNQIQFVGFAALIYYYSQNQTLDLWFGNLFANGSLNGDYQLIPEDEKYIGKLFINDLDELNEQTNYWRPRFNQFASEILKLVLVGLNRNNKSNWKDYLSRWSIDLIKSCRSNHEYLTEDLRELFKSLFLNRDNEDILGTDENYESEISDKKFSAIIRHIGEKDRQLSIFNTLVEAYPDEAHFRGHLGRFLYEKANEPREFDQAYDEITVALDIADNDYNLWHLKGMCNRRKIEFLIRSNLEAYSPDEIIDLELFIKELTQTANDDFNKSRSVNAFNLHVHTAQIQMLIQVIDFGRQISKSTTKEDFITDKNNEWYENQLAEVFNLLDEAKYIIELSKDIDQSKFIIKSKRMIEACEGKIFGLIGDYGKAVNKFKTLSENSDRSIRPYFRKMYVYATLASKVNNSYENFKHAWPKLSPFEFESLKKAIENNIREEPDNSNHIKLWLQAVRYSKTYFSLDECFSTVKVWYDNSLKQEISHLEATYYLYVIAACKAISDGDSIDWSKINEAKRYIQECKERKANDKFSFEWYGKNSGIKKLVNHSQLGKMNSELRFFDKSVLHHLGRVEGTISNIYERTRGKIILKCGLEAFFVPSAGGFNKNVDETTEVDFYVGFRQDGLFAWEVKRLHGNRTKQEPHSDVIVEIEDFDPIDEINHFEEISEAPPTDSVNDEKKENLRIVGKIDLSEFERKKNLK